MTLSQHASVRCQQRGIRSEEIKLFRAFGTRKRRPGNVFEYGMATNDTEKAFRYFKRCLQLLEKTKKKRILLDANQKTVITVYHKRN